MVLPRARFHASGDGNGPWNYSGSRQSDCPAIIGQESQPQEAADGRIADYCKERWGFNDSRARQLISAAKTAATVTTGNGLQTERAARELGKVPRDQRQAVVERAGEASNGKPLTAATIRKAAADFAEQEPADVLALPRGPFGLASIDARPLF